MLDIVITDRDSNRLCRKIFEQADICEMARRPIIGAPAAINTVTPCAACKLLRRRCAQECPFSPYFSPLEPNKFASVHKVFGASNVSKMLMVSLLRQTFFLIVICLAD